ncbi:MAG: CaiB/BaiF CoA-transferase family protein [Porticoccaceae bacterium]
MGPLKGYKILEIAGIGPGPFCAMMLADMGAEVIRIDRIGGGGTPVERAARVQTMRRNRRSIAVDLKNPDAIETVLKMCESADAILEGFRPGVMERLGLGPDVCLARNPRLVYGRMTGWGQSGPMSSVAGHDINYVALSGILGMLGRKDEKPLPSLNIIGDMGGGGLLLAFGMVCALLEAKTSGQGQVVDAAMTEGSAIMASTIYGLRAAGMWKDERGVNMLDSGAPYYEVYETSDGGYMAVGAMESQFYALLLEGLGLDPADLPKQMDTKAWPQMKEKFAAIFKSRTRDEWTRIFDGKDACVTPVLSLTEAAAHPHNVQRGAYMDDDGILQAAPAPQFSRTKPEITLPPPEVGEHTDTVLAEYGFGADEVASLKGSGAIN